MKTRFIILLPAILVFTSSLYAQLGSVSVSEVNLKDSDADISFLSENSSQTLSTSEEYKSPFDIALGDENDTSPQYGRFFGRNKIGIDLTPNIFIYGLPFAADMTAKYLGYSDTITEMLSGALSNDMLPEGSVDDVVFSIKSRLGSFGMAFNYDFVITSWLALALDVRFVIGTTSTGVDVEGAMKQTIKGRVEGMYEKELEGLGVGSLSELSTEQWKELVADYDYVYDFGLTTEQAAGLKSEGVGDASSYNSYDEFFDAVYATDTYKNSIKDSLTGSGSSTVSTTTITDSGDSDSGDMMSDILDAAFAGDLDDLDISLDLKYKFVESSLGLKFFPAKKAPYGFYLMPKIGFTYVDVNIDVSAPDSLKSTIAEQVEGFLGDDLPIGGSAWGVYTALEMGWQIQIGKNITKDWPVDFGIDVVLLDIGYYAIPWATGALANEMVQNYLDSFGVSGYLDDYRWATNLRLAFLPKIAFTVRF